MDDLILRINLDDIKDEEVLKTLIVDIVKLDDTNKIIELLDQLIERFKEEIIQNTLSELLTEDVVSERISNVKRIIQENTDLDFSKIDKLFDNKELKTKEIMEDILTLVDDEIDTLKIKLSKKIEKDDMQGLIIVEDLEKQINKYEEKKSKLIKKYNELILDITTEFKRREVLEYQKEYSELKKERIQLWEKYVKSRSQYNKADGNRFKELDKLIKEAEKNLKNLKEIPMTPYSSCSSKKLEILMQQYYEYQKNIQSNYDKKIDVLNVQLTEAKRLEALKKYRDNNGNKKNIDKKEEAKQLAKKALIAIAGFGTGLALSSVPGVGTIRMIAATAKLTTSAINVWTKKFPEGKVTKLINTTQEKFDAKFGDKISSFKEKHPKIISTAKIAKEKIKKILANKDVNLFINGLSVGYVVGNAVELFTGKNIFEHFNNGFNNDTTAVIDKTAEWNGTTEPTITEETGNLEVNIPIVEENVPNVEPIDISSSEITLEQGTIYDLSGISEGFVSSTSDQSVGLMTSVADDLTFDKIVNGRAHFIQSNGQGMAWYDLEDVQDYLSKASEVSSKVGGIK